MAWEPLFEIRLADGQLFWVIAFEAYSGRWRSYSCVLSCMLDMLTRVVMALVVG